MIKEVKELMGLVFPVQSVNPRAPQFSGELLVHGKMHRIALWEKEGANGTYYSFAITEMTERDLEFYEKRRAKALQESDVSYRPPNAPPAPAPAPVKRGNTTGFDAIAKAQEIADFYDDDIPF